VLATGGLSVPKTGSDGAGHAFAARLGHRIVPTTPALVPLILGEGFHAAVSGASLDVACALRNDGRLAARTTGPLLWTHAGVSGPAALDLSRHWHRAVEGGHAAAVQVNLRPGRDVGAIDHQLAAETIQRPRVLVTTVLASWVPASLAPHLATAAGLPAGRTLAHLRREDRRRLAHALGALPLDVRGSRGYAVAEATAGGVALEDVDPATLQSRRCPGLFFAGEILDVDGRLGGFNFQWAWASGFVAGTALSPEPV
jgi:predicted Rossmann fold flavoprotein